MRVSETWVIIHNSIVRMVSNLDDEDEESGILTEMYEEKYV